MKAGNTADTQAGCRTGQREGSVSLITCSLLRPRRKRDANCQIKTVFHLSALLVKTGVDPCYLTGVDIYLAYVPSTIRPDFRESCEVTKNGIFIPIVQ